MAKQNPGHMFTYLTMREWDRLTEKIETALAQVMDVDTMDELTEIHGDLVTGWQSYATKAEWA